MRSFKTRLQTETTPLSGFVSVFPSAVVAQAVAAAGADWIMIDQEHGPIGSETMHAMIAATAGTGCAPIVRVGKIDPALVKTALDAGAEGIVYPLVRNAEEAANCVAYTRYPPHGVRGWGPFVAHARWGTSLADYMKTRGDATVCGLLIETQSAIDNIESICKVGGIDFCYIAQFDLSVDLGVPGDFEDPGFKAAFAHAERVIIEHKIPVGGAALHEAQTRDLVARGHRVLLQGFDALMLADGVRKAKTWLVNT